MKPTEIKQIRTDLGMSQARFADALGITRRYVVKLEAGEAVPSRPLELAIRYIKEQSK